MSGRFALPKRQLPVLISMAPLAAWGQIQRTIATNDGGETQDASPLKPLSWWTKNLKRDARDEWLASPDSKDYRVEQRVTRIGAISGKSVAQIITTIHEGSRIVSQDGSDNDVPLLQWKSLLVQTGHADYFIEIYRLQAYGYYKRLNSATIYGAGSDAILRTFDFTGGNGGYCYEGYWWFDKTGPHQVDFSSLRQAVSRAIPKGSTFTSDCWALHPETNELDSVVQRLDARCHACGFVGNVHAQYKIEQGIAVPVSIRFTPEDSE